MLSDYSAKMNTITMQCYFIYNAFTAINQQTLDIFARKFGKENTPRSGESNGNKLQTINQRLAYKLVDDSKKIFCV